MKAILTAARIIVGLLFIFSGLVKANDPLGLSYKMQEFFEVWGWQSLNDFTLFMSLTMNGFEIIAGVAVLLGWRMRLFSWLLLLLIIFFTFLTGYAVMSGKIHACGCFGDCIPLTANQSFIKDIVLLVLILFIFVHRQYILPILSSATCGSIIIATGFFVVLMQWFVLKYLPIVDCLPYKVGSNIPEQMKMPAGAVPDSFAINFKYRKDGKDVEFDMDHFPADFNDSAYQFIERTQKLVKEGTGNAKITDFVLTSMSGTDTTQAILGQPNYYVLFFLKDLTSSKKGWEDHITQIINICKQKRYPFFVVSSVTDLAKAHLEEIPGIDTAHVNYLKCDATVIKTAARENPTYIIMKQGTVVAKHAASAYKKIDNRLKQLQ